MSKDSSSKPPKRHPDQHQWGSVEGVILGFLSYKIPEWFVGSVAPVLLPQLPLSSNVRSFLLYGMFEVMAIAAVTFLVYGFGYKLKDVGLGAFKPGFIFKAIVGFCVYFVLSILVYQLAQIVVQVPQQTQQVGFSNPAGYEKALVFVALVMIVPLAEELLFRGFLYKGIRRDYSFWVTTFVVSALFALAHGQLDVGLDVFALSLVLCYLREKTESIWPGILLHGLKNAVAFFTLFIYNVH